MGWKGCLDDLVARESAAPVWCAIDGHPGLRKAVGLVWPAALVQRCCVHKLRNLEREAPKHALAEIRVDFHRIVYADSTAAARAASAAFERKWTSGCPGVVRSLQKGGEELLTFFQFPKQVRLWRLDGWRQIPVVLRAPRVGGMTHRAFASGARSSGRPISGYSQNWPFLAIQARAMLRHQSRTEAWSIGPQSPTALPPGVREREGDA
jgi:Transposase, Mutator family